MNKIFYGKFLALYNQIGLYDTEDSNSYPSWETGLELAVFGSKGVAVSAKGDTYVEITIYNDAAKIEDLLFYGKGQIGIGKKGLTVGNEIAASTGHLDWKEGSVLVEVYGNNRQNEASKIVFVLNKAGK